MLRVFRHYVSALALAVIAADYAIIAGAVALVRSTGEWIGDGALAPKAVALGAVIGFTFYLADLYRTDVRFGGRELVARLVVALPLSALLTAALGFALPTLRFGRMGFAQIFVLLSLGLFVWRLLWHELASSQRLSSRVLILGLSSVAHKIIDLQETGAQPFTVLGFLDDAPDAHERLPGGIDLLGKTRDVLNLVDELEPDVVLVALPDMRGALPLADLLDCRLRGIRVEDWPTFYEKQTGKVLVTNLRPSWLIFSDGFARPQVRFKRALDIVLSLTGLVLAFPAIVAVAIAIKLDSRGPTLFRQHRVGQNGRIFTLTKFRSMRADAEAVSGAVWARTRDPRVTRVGRFLRAARLDELPQLLNVLLGDMSFVGPRPERPEFVRVLQRQIPYYTGRLAVKPGITGWAQVRHQYAASVEDTLEKLQYDLYYIKNASAFLDVLILLSTIQVVLFARGAR